MVIDTDGKFGLLTADLGAVHVSGEGFPGELWILPIA